MVRRTLVCVAVLAATTISVPAGANPAARATGLSYSGDAYGSYATVGSTVLLGKSAPVGLGACSFVVGIHRSNTVASVDGAPILTTGQIDTTADTKAISGGSAARTSADVHDASVLSGLITATELRSVSTTSVDATGFHTSAAGTAGFGLVVAGVPISGTPAPNTVVSLPGFGSVTLNEQRSHVTATSAQLTVNMIHVDVTESNPLVPVGTQIIVSHASSGLQQVSSTQSLDGQAYGSFAFVGSVVLAGRTAPVAMPCQGTGGNILTNAVSAVNVPPIVTSGTVTDTAQGTVSSTLASAETTSTVQSASLLDATVTANLVVADAHASSTGGSVTLSDEGSSIVNLVINGTPYSGDPAPNTKVQLPGIGTLWLHRVIQTPNSIEIRMIEIVVTKDNPLGLQIGTDVRVAVAEASVH
jgi:hypothetical protein